MITWLSQIRLQGLRWGWGLEGEPWLPSSLRCLKRALVPEWPFKASRSDMQAELPQRVLTLFPSAIGNPG